MTWKRDDWGVRGDFGSSSDARHPSRSAQGEPPGSAVELGAGSPPPCPEETPAAPRRTGRARVLRSRLRQSTSSCSPSPRQPGTQRDGGASAAPLPLSHPPGGCSPQRPPPSAAGWKNRGPPRQRLGCGTTAARPPPHGRRRHLSAPRRSVTAAGGGRRAPARGRWERAAAAGRDGAQRREIPHFVIVSGGRAERG